MHNLVGNHVPSEAEIQKDIKALATLRARHAKSTVKLTSEDRKRAVRMRTGGEKIALTIITLAQKTGLVLAKASPDDIKRDLLVAERYKPLLAELDEIRSLISDTILEAESEAWAAAQTYYSSLVRMQSGDGNLESALAPVIDFFATGRRSSKPEENGADNNGNNQTPPA